MHWYRLLRSKSGRIPHIFSSAPLSRPSSPNLCNWNSGASVISTNTEPIWWWYCFILLLFLFKFHENELKFSTPWGRQSLVPRSPGHNGSFTALPLLDRRGRRRDYEVHRHTLKSPAPWCCYTHSCSPLYQSSTSSPSTSSPCPAPSGPADSTRPHSTPSIWRSKLRSPTAVPRTASLSTLAAAAADSEVRLARKMWIKCRQEALFAMHTPFAVCLASGILKAGTFRHFIARYVYFLKAFGQG